MSRNFVNIDWQLPVGADGNIRDWTALQCAILLDIRDELRKINEILRYRPNDTVADNLLTMKKPHGGE